MRHKRAAVRYLVKRIHFCNADLRLLIAVLHSSLNHGFRLFDLVEDFGIHSSEMSCNAEVKE